MNEAVANGAPDIDFDTPKLKRHRKVRFVKDKAANLFVATGGIFVIVAVTLIFFYLLYEVVPLFKAATIEPVASYAVPNLVAESADAPDQGAVDSAQAGASQGTKTQTIYLATEEQAEIGLRIDDLANATFFYLADGTVHSTTRLPIPAGTSISSVGEGTGGSRVLALGLSDGSGLVVKHNYKITYPDNIRLITPRIDFPFGESPVEIDEKGDPITNIVVRDTDNSLILIGAAAGRQLKASYFTKEEDFLSGDITLEKAEITMPVNIGDIFSLQLSPDTSWLYVATDSGELKMFDLRNRSNPSLVMSTQVTDNANLAYMRFLLGGISLLIADDRGNISQWFPVRDEQNEYRLERVRTFDNGDAKITKLGIEERRKGFFAVTDDGTLAIYNSTAERVALREMVADQPIVNATLAPRANFALLETADHKMHFWSINNEHPDVSWSALWQQVWYENYEDPEFIWQSSAANTDFEPKYSLVPLSFGTLKAAFYAMLIATPLAICGALYTAHFMSPALRKKVKPVIELMEALPTVILGFLAGLFFAPYIEANLPGVFTLLILIPVSVLLFGFAWTNLPEKIRHKVEDGWEVLLLIPLIIFVGWFSFAISPTVESAFFGGDTRFWLENTAGIDFDQRNALVVGAAMGFAVIPTIFSITEDAVFGVPKHLTYGSLALGATPWQTMVRVVLPTASPGIFSAVMIGLGRAVGETMIVLMATGNTPIMDINIFEGMRTLAANIAVEMPESEVGSSHYRILFLAAFVLFIFTFCVNTLAEFVRQRLRNKYSVI